jgi:hypothetical protein
VILLTTVYGVSYSQTVNKDLIQYKYREEIMRKRSSSKHAKIVRNTLSVLLIGVFLSGLVYAILKAFPLETDIEEEGDILLTNQRFQKGGDLHELSTFEGSRDCPIETLPDYARSFPLKYGDIRWTGCLAFQRMMYVEDYGPIKGFAITEADPEAERGILIQYAVVRSTDLEYVQAVVAQKEILGHMISLNYLLNNLEGGLLGITEGNVIPLADGLAHIALKETEQYLMDLPYVDVDPYFEGKYVYWDGISHPDCMALRAILRLSETRMIVSNDEGLLFLAESNGCNVIPLDKLDK